MAELHNKNNKKKNKSKLKKISNKKFATESYWTFKLGLFICINSISYMRQSNLLLLFFRTLNWRIFYRGCTAVLTLKVLTNGGSVMFGYALVKASSHVAHIIRVARITF